MVIYCLFTYYLIIIILFTIIHSKYSYSTMHILFIISVEILANHVPIYVQWSPILLAGCTLVNYYLLIVLLTIISVVFNHCTSTVLVSGYTLFWLMVGYWFLGVVVLSIGRANGYIVVLGIMDICRPRIPTE